MKRFIKLLRFGVRCLFEPVIELVRLWEKDDFGKHLLQMLIEILLLIHLVRELAPHVTQPFQ